MPLKLRIKGEKIRKGYLIIHNKVKSRFILLNQINFNSIKGWQAKHDGTVILNLIHL